MSCEIFLLNWTKHVSKPFFFIIENENRIHKKRFSLVYIFVISFFFISNEILLLQDGSILAWKFNVATNCFEPAASLKGHSRGVVSLVVGANRLYSGSMDNTIRVSLHKLFAINA